MTPAPLSPGRAAAATSANSTTRSPRIDRGDVPGDASDVAIREFALERYFARWEFSARHLLSASDCEPLTVRELLDIAGLGTSVLEELQVGYVESQGTTALRERIAALYPGLSSDDV